MAAGQLDLNDDDIVSRAEVAVFLGMAAAYYHALPLTASYDRLAAWVQRELNEIWPPGVPVKTPYSLDRALKARASSWVEGAGPEL